MIELGIIGTNWITHQFVAAALATKKYRLAAVYSRTLATAQQFAEKYPGEVVCSTELPDFFALPQVATVYIASPNSLHYEQAKQAILAGKNVIVEKPAFTTIAEMDEIIQLANQQRVFFFEAARNIHEASFKKIAEVIKAHGPIIGANFSYMKYSSRYDQVLAGAEPNIFSPAFSGGALMDLGVYLVYAALGWFGKPQNGYYFARKVATEVDGLGFAILRYEDFDVMLQPGKIGDAFMPSEIYFAEGTLTLNGVNAIETANYYDRRTQQRETIAVQAVANPMIEEAADFAEVILRPTDPVQGKKYEEWVELARNVNEMLYILRKDAGICFTADKEE